ncbi:UvrD-helicase domain-containing protein [Thermobrachium celere]|uniref:UvrD-helicase domain-containing protein n=1 Tax=Thermobrachium celere TaxID=53422 RepID=UPI0019422AA6|nr:UvrD-helicase domain-containing protein [Thermobrachium celere]GFR36593.1 hypothetical protein TCEA9_24050 [Thermobrachium celere]
MILINEKMLKKIRNETNKKKINKIFEYAYEIRDNFYNEIRKGTYIRKIKGINANIYKFRLNIGDRVLFIHGSDIDGIREEYRNSILLLDYCNHDDQEFIAKNIEEIKIVEYKKDEEEKELIDELIYRDYLSYQFIIDDEINIILEDYEYAKLLEEKSSLDNDGRTKNVYRYYLNNDQYECLCSKNATIIKGSAGSGKTTVLIYRLNGFKEKETKIAYFTYTKNLKREAEEIFKQIKSRDSNANIYFFDFLNYCRETLKISMDEIVNYNKFKKWYEEKISKYNKNLFNVIDVWGEIKGIIKGCMGINWIRDGYIPSDFFSEDEINLLKENNYIEFVGNKYKFWTKSISEMVDELNKKGYKNNSLINRLKNFYLLNKIIINKFIEKETYLNLPESYSIFNREEKEQIYEIALKYQKWLDENKYLDENDLIIEIISKLEQSEIEKFDYIVLDEIQDLTELQIWLIFNLVKDKNNLFFCRRCSSNNKSNFF